MVGQAVAVLADEVVERSFELGLLEAIVSRSVARLAKIPVFRPGRPVTALFHQLNYN